METEKILEVDATSLLIQQLLQFETNKNISTIQLNEKEISIIQFLAKNSPDFLNGVKTCLLEIIKDGKIDSNDIPQFFILIKNIYTLFHKQPQIKINDIASTVGSILKYIIHIILNNNITNPELINCCDSLVNICIEMIELQSSLTTKTCFKLC
jgi:hypothetical protein